MDNQNILEEKYLYVEEEDISQDIPEERSFFQDIPEGEDVSQNIPEEGSSLQDIMEHETHNIYVDEKIECPYLSATWWIADEENNRLDEAGESLDKMFDMLTIRPVNIDKADERIFCARYEFPAYGEDFTYISAIEEIEEEGEEEDVIAFFDFPIGIFYGCVERVGILGEESSIKKIGEEGEDSVVPPMPDDLFEEKEGMTLAATLLWLAEDDAIFLVDSIGGQDEVENHWWMRFYLTNSLSDDRKMPVPGEFVSLVIFIFPNLVWGHQLTNPFIFAGNWIETVFYTSGIVKTADTEQGEYVVQYRKNEVHAVSSDWAEYKVDDRVTILKKIPAPFSTFTWEDLGEFEENEWVIVPVTFYDDDEEEE